MKRICYILMVRLGVCVVLPAHAMDLSTDSDGQWSFEQPSGFYGRYSEYDVSTDSVSAARGDDAPVDGGRSRSGDGATLPRVDKPYGVPASYVPHSPQPPALGKLTPHDATSSTSSPPASPPPQQQPSYTANIRFGRLADNSPENGYSSDVPTSDNGQPAPSQKPPKDDNFVPFDGTAAASTAPSPAPVPKKTSPGDLAAPVIEGFLILAGVAILYNEWPAFKELVDDSVETGKACATSCYASACKAAANVYEFAGRWAKHAVRGERNARSKTLMLGALGCYSVWRWRR